MWRVQDELVENEKKRPQGIVGVEVGACLGGSCCWGIWILLLELLLGTEGDNPFHDMFESFA